MSGTVIAQNSIVDPNCQNLVIRNVEGEIVAKTALYISKEKGEVLFNCFANLSLLFFARYASKTNA